MREIYDREALIYQTLVSQSEGKEKFTAVVYATPTITYNTNTLIYDFCMYYFFAAIQNLLVFIH